MSVTAAQVKAMPSGEFASLSDATVDAYIAKAARRINSTTWGSLYDDAILYLTCHLLAVDKGGSGAPTGAVVSESAGSMSRSYAVAAPAAAGGNLDSTGYGATFKQMLRELAVTPVVC